MTDYVEKKYTRKEISDNLKYGANVRRAICEQLRQIYDLVYELPDGTLKNELEERLIDALGQAKDMGDRLTYLFWKYHDTTGHLRYRVPKKYDSKTQLRVKKMRMSRL